MEATHVVGDSDELMWWACADHLIGYEVICTKARLFEKLSADAVLKIMGQDQ